MYDNIGRKIKGLAMGLFIAQAACGVILGFVLMWLDEDLILYGLLSLILGPLFAWISSWLLYGFGELIDKVSDIERNTRGETGNDAPAVMPGAGAARTAQPSYAPTMGTGAGRAVQPPATPFAGGTVKKCDFCGKENAQGAHCKIVDDFGTRFRNLCYDCMAQSKADISIQ